MFFLRHARLAYTSFKPEMQRILKLIEITLNLYSLLKKKYKIVDIKLSLLNPITDQVLTIYYSSTIDEQNNINE